MATLDASETGYSDILSAIREWPVEERLALIHDILRTLVPANGVSIPKHTWGQAAGLLTGPWPTPTDEGVERMLGESRAEKYG